jgi:hypothetical protein
VKVFHVTKRPDSMHLERSTPKISQLGHHRIRKCADGLILQRSIIRDFTSFGNSKISSSFCNTSEARTQSYVYFLFFAGVSRSDHGRDLKIRRKGEDEDQCDCSDLQVRNSTKSKHVQLLEKYLHNTILATFECG